MPACVNCGRYPPAPTPQVAPAELEIEEAKRVLGVEMALVGALGKRTKFQEKEVSQLTLRATLLAHAQPRPAPLEEATKAMMPRKCASRSYPCSE